MGSTLTVITTVITLLQVTHSARCIGPSDEKSEDADLCNEECANLTDKGEDICKRKTTSLGYCRWETDDGRIILHDSVLAPIDTSTGTVMTRPGKSAKPVKFSSGRVTKDLVPIEAWTEWMGDVIYYNVFLKMMTDQFAPVLNGDYFPGDFQIDESPYPTAEEVIPRFCRKPEESQDLTPEEEESPENPVQTFLQYSRPLYNTIPYDENLVTSVEFTVGNAVTIAIMAWMDLFFMNNDRFILCPELQTHANSNNMMLYKYNAHGKERYEYFPIDQGFARMVYFSWYKTIYSNNRGPRTWPNQQLLYSESGLKLTTTPVQLAWEECTANFLEYLKFEKGGVEKKMGKEKRKKKKRKMFSVEDFVKNNLVYFPRETKSDFSFKSLVMYIIENTWKGLAVELLEDTWDEYQKAITKLKEMINDKHLEMFKKPSKSKSKKSKAISKSKSKKSKAKKSKTKKSAFSRIKSSLIKPPTILEKSTKQWEKVIKGIDSSFGFAYLRVTKPFEDERILYHTKIKNNFNVLVKDFDPRTVSGKTPHVQDFDQKHFDSERRSMRFGTIGGLFGAGAAADAQIGYHDRYYAYDYYNGKTVNAQMDYYDPSTYDLDDNFNNNNEYNGINYEEQRFNGYIDHGSDEYNNDAILMAISFVDVVLIAIGLSCLCILIYLVAAGGIFVTGYMFGRNNNKCKRSEYEEVEVVNVDSN
eukprot:210888_1